MHKINLFSPPFNRSSNGTNKPFLASQITAPEKLKDEQILFLPSHRPQKQKEATGIYLVLGLAYVFYSKKQFTLIGLSFIKLRIF